MFSNLPSRVSQWFNNENQLFAYLNQMNPGLCKLLLLCLLLTSPLGYAQSHLQLIDNNEVILLTPHLKIYLEDQQELSIEQVTLMENQFTWHLGNNPNYGMHANGLWLHANFSNLTDRKKWVVNLNFTQLAKVDMYLFDKEQLIAQSHQEKFSTYRDYRRPTLEADLPYATKLDLFIRLQSHDTGLVAPIFIQSAQVHTRQNLYDNLLWGLFYGGLLLLAIYNFGLYFSFKEKSQLSYVGYVISLVIWQLVWGSHLQVLFPVFPVLWLSMHTDLIFVFLGISSGIFTYTFLEVPKTAPKAGPVIHFVLILLVTLGLSSSISLFPPMWQSGAVYLVSILAIGSYLYAGFESYQNQFKPARYFVFAWIILAFVALSAMFGLLGIVPVSIFTNYCFQVGAFLQVGLFSLALMDKSRGKLEREVEQVTNDLLNNMELIEEQNARLDISRKDAIKASHVKSQFLANMSHEIRTPLNAILGFSKELSQLSLPQEKQEQVMIINSAADNLLTIVNDVLDFSKIEAGKLKINSHPFSPQHLLEELVSVMAKSAHLKKLEFIFELAPLPEKLIGDEYRIKQILNNLLTNAIKFTSSGHITLSAAGQELDYGLYELQLKIEDTGIGISREDRKKLFNAFSQIDDALSRSYQGTGLGLVICQELTTLMNGTLNMQSIPGQGSCFSVKLLVNKLSHKTILSNHPDWFGKKVVIFDPYPFTRRASAGILVALGAQVSSVESTEYLASLTGQYDFLFATLPQIKFTQRERQLPALMQFSATRKILLYSGLGPFSQHPSLSQRFSAQLRMPLTLSKIEHLLQRPPENEKNLLLKKLKLLPPAKILAVDDMEMNLRLLQTWLKPSNLQLTIATSGRDAVALCQKTDFDLILMDVQMPHMDGLEATRLIRKTALNLGTPIVAVTAHAFKEEQERLLDSGMDDYLPKPLELTSLVQLIMRWCQIEQTVQSELLSFDWQLALKQANHNEQIAKQMLEDFSVQLPIMRRGIEACWQQEDMEQLQQKIHQLHGVCCYTGVEQLRLLCNEIEGALKKGELSHVRQRIPALLNEVEQVLLAVNKPAVTQLS
jgi:two-component system sensor histidine kinase BarA